MRIEVYVINLEGSEARLAVATAMLGATGIAFQRLPAYDGRGMRPEELPLYDPAQARAVFGRVLTGGEVGCFLSHLEGARKFLATDAEHGLVLEDDLSSSQEARQVLESLIQRLKAGAALKPWHVVNVGREARGRFTVLADVGRGHQLVRAHCFPLTTTALLWNREGAAAFLRDAGAITMPVDKWLQRWATEKCSGLALNPPILPARGAASEIDAADDRGAKQRGSRYLWFKQIRKLRVEFVARRAQRTFEQIVRGR